VTCTLLELLCHLGDRATHGDGHRHLRFSAARLRIAGPMWLDVVVQIDSALPEMEDKGLVRRERVALGTTGFGIAIRSGDPAPDIATPEALQGVLLGATKVIYNDPAVTPSGKLLLSIAEQLGVADQVKAKLQVVAAGANVTTLAKDSGDGPVISLGGAGRDPWPSWCQGDRPATQGAAGTAALFRGTRLEP
jgi:Bacterial extracellular solute-binding protein